MSAMFEGARHNAQYFHCRGYRSWGNAQIHSRFFHPDEKSAKPTCISSVCFSIVKLKEQGRLSASRQGAAPLLRGGVCGSDYKDDTNVTHKGRSAKK